MAATNSQNHVIPVGRRYIFSACGEVERITKSNAFNEKRNFCN